MISDEEALKALYLLEDYCREKRYCDGCVFKPKEYIAGVRECILEDQFPKDAASDVRKELIKNGKDKMCK